ncbi:calmodulin-like protein 4 isoform X1 [Ornithodoros turicata]|uniref:calmodulin-like protein 4 isoform X1 n=1 Tax=Ornithodoros turicata TaxID=34597 RepID=UPI0031390002
MARYFREQDIDEFRDCFYLNAHSGQIRTLDELTVIMRSLGLSPTITELKKYYKNKGTLLSALVTFIVSMVFKTASPKAMDVLHVRPLCLGGKISFADFLEIMHSHSEKESIPQEIVDAFRASDRSDSGQISGKELRRILIHWGEKLSPREVDNIFREANISPTGPVRYETLVRVVCAPVPDYY